MRITFCEWVIAPFVPVTVSVNVPRGPPLAAVIVRVDGAELPAGTNTTGGLNAPEVLFGSPLTDKRTLPLKPLSEVTVTLY